MLCNRPANADNRPHHLLRCSHLQCANLLSVLFWLQFVAMKSMACACSAFLLQDNTDAGMQAASSHVELEWCHQGHAQRQWQDQPDTAKASQIVQPACNIQHSKQRKNRYRLSSTVLQLQRKEDTAEGSCLTHVFTCISYHLDLYAACFASW